jgi:hypothetical protein
MLALVSLILSGVGTTVASAQTKVTGTIGSTVSDGDMSFEVQSMKCGIATAGVGFFQAKALGQFCVVEVTFRALKKKAVSYFSTN